MKKYLFLLLLAGVGAVAFAQTEKVVDMAKILKKDVSSLKKVSWKAGVRQNGYGTYRMPYRAIRQQVKAPLRGSIETAADGFYIRSANKFPDVVCFAKGVVKRSGDGELVIDHGNGFESFYGNISSLTLKTGDRVKKGQLAGRMQGDKKLLFGLRLNGVPVDVRNVFETETGLVSYAGNLFIYNLNDSVFLSRNAPMTEFSQKKDKLDEEFVFYYKKAVSSHRAKRDFIDETLQNATKDEISLEDVQIGPAQKQDTIRVRNNIVL